MADFIAKGFSKIVLGQRKSKRGLKHMDNYKTKDLAEGAMLLVMKRNLLGIEREGNICYFVFENKKRCEELSQQFFFDTLLVDARSYHEAMVRLKSRIFAE